MSTVWVIFPKMTIRIAIYLGYYVAALQARGENGLKLYVSSYIDNYEGMIYLTRRVKAAI